MQKVAWNVGEWGRLPAAGRSLCVEVIAVTAVKPIILAIRAPTRARRGSLAARPENLWNIPTNPHYNQPITWCKNWRTVRARCTDGRTDGTLRASRPSLYAYLKLGSLLLKPFWGRDIVKELLVPSAVLQLLFVLVELRAQRGCSGV